jgi:hypothetical protein
VIINAIAKKHGIEPHQIEILRDGEVILPHQTPAELHLVNEEELIFIMKFRGC